MLLCPLDTLIHTPSLSHLHTCAYTVHFHTYINMLLFLPNKFPKGTDKVCHKDSHLKHALILPSFLASSLYPCAPTPDFLKAWGFMSCVVDLPTYYFLYY